ncbi:MAG: hypothetical protein AAF334_03335 [Pseudomonadota bacterium]
MAERDPDRFTSEHWPLLLAGCGALVLWYLWGDNFFAGMAGFGGLGWLAWHRLIKPRL